MWLDKEVSFGGATTICLVSIAGTITIIGEFLLTYATFATLFFFTTCQLSKSKHASS